MIAPGIPIARPHSFQFSRRRSISRRISSSCIAYFPQRRSSFANSQYHQVLRSSLFFTALPPKPLARSLHHQSTKGDRSPPHLEKYRLELAKEREQQRATAEIPRRGPGWSRSPAPVPPKVRACWPAPRRTAARFQSRSPPGQQGGNEVNLLLGEWLDPGSR